jgi:hypothetical protein
MAGFFFGNGKQQSKWVVNRLYGAFFHSGSYWQETLDLWGPFGGDGR